MPSFGRLVQHDPRSREFSAPRAVTPRSVLWGHHAPVLDQGQLGSCTGNAMAQCLNTDAFAKNRISGYLTEADAVKLYSAATKLDDSPGTYPPQDTGSSGLAVAKAAKSAKYITTYAHCFGFDHFAATLQLQPVIVGTDWYSAMMTPNAAGVVRPKGTVEGGHEYLAIGIDYTAKMLTFLNSWSDTWGVSGRFHMSFTDFTKLLDAQGDVTAPTPIGQ